MSLHTNVTVKLTRQGWHSWPDATAPRLYLKALHRHMFHIAVTVAVRHDNRDIEFHDLAEIVAAWWGDENDQADRGSCEHIATELHLYLTALLADRNLLVAVGEDGEAYATVTAY